MAAKKTTLKEIGEMLAHVVKHMATKDDIAWLDKRIDKLDAKIDSVESNLAGKINRLDTKLTKFEEHELDKRKARSPRLSDRKTPRPRQKDRRLIATRTIATINSPLDAGSRPPWRDRLAPTGDFWRLQNTQQARPAGCRPNEESQALTRLPLAILSMQIYYKP
jgi:hypothetical protein